MKRFLLSTAAVTIFCNGAALAQDASSSSEAANQDARVDEILVTAQRRAQPLQDVPTSVQIVSGEAIVKSSISSLIDMTQTTPSVHISNDGAGGQAFIRGIGSGTNMIFNQSVSTFIDDIYHGSAHSTAASFLDVERVEILKGPQSTFFGNNAIAGAISITTKKPTVDSMNGTVRALYGQYGQYIAEGAVNVPVSDQFAFRVAGNLNGLDGWQKNPYVGEKQPNRKNMAGRISALWKPSENFDAVLKVEGSKNVSRTGQAIGNCPPPAPFTVAGFCSTALALGIPTDGLYGDTNTSSPGQGIRLTTFDSVLTANYHMEGLTLSSVTGYSKFSSLQHLDADATPLDLLNYEVQEKYRQFSQEFRITSSSDQPFEYMIGAYFQSNKTTGNPGALSYFFLSPIIQGNAALAPLVPYLPIGQSPYYRQDEKIYSIFGSVSWHITDALTINGGLRQTWDTKDALLDAYNGTATQSFGNIVPFPANLQSVLDPLAASLIGGVQRNANKETYSTLMPSAGIQYKFAPQKMAYATYSRGSKAGVPVTSFNTSVPSTPVDPEYVDAYEVGLKTEWFNRTLLLNIAAFRSDYRNLQVSASQFTPAGALVFGVANAAASRSQGVEVEGQWVVSRNFRLAASVTYLDSIFKSYKNAAPGYFQRFCRSNAALPVCVAAFPGGAPATEDFSGRRTTFAPEWSGSVSGTYTTELNSTFNLITNLTAIFATKTYIGNTGTPDDLLAQHGYVRLDGRIGLETADGQWSVELIAKNINNVHLYGGGNQGTGLPTSTGSQLVQREQPRNFALQVRYAF